MYNQPTTRSPNGTYVGTLYKNPIDCLWKTLKTEGPFALYKGGGSMVYPDCDWSSFLYQGRPLTSSGLHLIRMFTHQRVHGLR